VCTAAPRLRLVIYPQWIYWHFGQFVVFENTWFQGSYNDSRQPWLSQPRLSINRDNITACSENEERGVWTKCASRGQYAPQFLDVGVVFMSTNPYAEFWQKQSRHGDRECEESDASKDSAALLGLIPGQHSQATGRGIHTQRHVNLADRAALNHVSDTGAGAVRWSDWRACCRAQQNIEVRLRVWSTETIKWHLMMIAFITFKSSLVPLFEGLW